MPDFDIIQYYSDNASALTERYRRTDADIDAYLAPFYHFFPSAPARLLDIGAGSGRDSSYFRRKGYRVVATEPAAGFVHAAAEHPHEGIDWIQDSLPDLRKLCATPSAAGSFDIVYLNAVWMHIPPAERPAAWRTIDDLLKPGGMIFLAHRLPPDPARGMHATDPAETASPTPNLSEVHHEIVKDILGRPDVQWSVHILLKKK